MPNNNYSILVVDDNEMNRDIISRRLGNLGYATHTACDGQQAIDMLNGHNYDLLLLDVMMPKLNGYDVLEQMKTRSLLDEISVIMVSALDETDSAIKCIGMGADDYLGKPINQTLLKTKVRALLEKKELLKQEKALRKQIDEHNQYLEKRIQEQVREISSAQLSTIFSLSKLAESRDPETGEHLERVREYCKVLSEQLRMTTKYKEQIDDAFIENIYAASALHDIGKVGTPDHILQKPGKLTASEWECVKQHPVLGAETLRAVDKLHPGNTFIHIGIAITESHHEKWDGSGYPNGLQGKQIPLVARIMALSDVYDALTSKRAYKNAFTHEKSYGIIIADKGKHFDPDVVDAFEKTETIFKQIHIEYVEL